MAEPTCRERHPGTQYLCMKPLNHTDDEHRVFFGLVWNNNATSEQTHTEGD